MTDWKAVWCDWVKHVGDFSFVFVFFFIELWLAKPKSGWKACLEICHVVLQRKSPQSFAQCLCPFQPVHSKWNESPFFQGLQSWVSLDLKACIVLSNHYSPHCYWMGPCLWWWGYMVVSALPYEENTRNVHGLDTFTWQGLGEHFFGSCIIDSSHCYGTGDMMTVQET